MSFCSSFRIFHFPSPRRCFGDFVQQTCLSCCTPDHMTNQIVVLHLSAFFFFISYSQLYHRSVVSSHTGGSTPLYSQRPAAHRPTNCCSCPFCLFALTFLVISAMTFVLCCCLISSISVLLSCMCRCRSYSLNHEKILAQQSSPLFRDCYF